MNDVNHGLAHNKAIRLALTAVLVFLSIFLIAATISTLKNTGRAASPATDVVTVSADGQATMPPDVARISFTVQHTAPAVADAQKATTDQANTVIASLKEQGIADKDVKTLSYNITPQYAYQNPCQFGVCPTYSSSKVTGYQVSETVQVTVRDLAKVGALLGSLGKLSVQNVSGPDFALDDSTAGYNAARADAIVKAKAQAAQLAKDLGVKLGKIVNYNESSGGNVYNKALYGMDAMGGATRAESSPAPTVPVGENTYSASVSITYEIR